MLTAVAGALVLAPSAFSIGQVLPKQDGLADRDARTGTVLPWAAQRAAVSRLGAHATWNRFGTPASLINYRGYLATGLKGNAVRVARTFIAKNRVLFRLTATGVSRLALVNDSRMVKSPGHAVLFRQRFGSLGAVQDGLISVGVTGGRVAYVSSSSAGDGNVPARATLSPAEAWARAASAVGLKTSIVQVLSSKKDRTTGWTGLKVAGFGEYQRVRLTAFPTYTQGIRAAYEALVLKTDGAWPVAYKELVDARTGTVWFRENAVDSLSDATVACDPTAQNCVYEGTLAVGSTVQCGPYEGPFVAPAGTQSIAVTANTDVPANDIVLELDRPKGTSLAGSDTLFSPEAIHYEPDGGVPAGPYYIRVCPFSHAPADYTSPYTYHGTVTMNTASGTHPLATTPKWKVFPANPALTYATKDSRKMDCWLASLNGRSQADRECQVAVANPASRAPWDFDVQANQSTHTTRGNNANTAEAWGSPLTPGGAQRPVAVDRRYAPAWTNSWYASKCDPTTLVPGGNDIDAAVTNLFVGHNRMHDFSYELGFTESNFNAQQSNFGNSAPGPYPLGRENDPETGDVQAGAVSGGSPTYEGRDNANQITLDDGVPPITNQYLWQPIAGAFYPPCVDGDFDTSVFGHEYTHLISNRMVAGPDAGLTGLQGGAMGESWSDLDALEYEHEYGLVPTGGENPWSLGAYATGNKARGIRDYPLNANPLNFSDVGFDTPGPEVHADGEIWNGVNYDLRQALVSKYNARYPAGRASLQRTCAQGKLPPSMCPGNRRWVQIMYDAWLLMQSGVSMVDARNAYLAADRMRFGGANQATLWRAFAHRGLGAGASSDTGEDDQPRPSFRTPLGSNATVTFGARALDQKNRRVEATIYVGKYEGRATAIADTKRGALPASAVLVPGRYDFVVQARGYGAKRFIRTLRAGKSTVLFGLKSNWASRWRGASISGPGAGQKNLIDDTEGTDWTATVDTPTVEGAKVTVRLAGAHRITAVRVSAMIGPDSSRFAALRRFAIEACRATTANGGCSKPTAFRRIYASAVNAFPGTRPRPVAPDLIMRTFLVKPTTATHLRLVVLSNQCTGGSAYRGELDNDPTNDTDCTTASAESQNVAAAELEALSG